MTQIGVVYVVLDLTITDEVHLRSAHLSKLGADTEARERNERWRIAEARRLKRMMPGVSDGNRRYLQHRIDDLPDQSPFKVERMDVQP